MSPLHDPAQSGCVETVHCLLQLGADPNLLSGRGRPALYSALQAGDVDCVEMLIGVTNKGDHHSMIIFRSQLCSGLESCVWMLAESRLKIIPKIEQFLEK